MIKLLEWILIMRRQTWRTSTMMWRARVEQPNRTDTRMNDRATERKQSQNKREKFNVNEWYIGVWKSARTTARLQCEHLQHLANAKAQHPDGCQSSHSLLRSSFFLFSTLFFVYRFDGSRICFCLCQHNNQSGDDAVLGALQLGAGRNVATEGDAFATMDIVACCAPKIYSRSLEIFDHFANIQLLRVAFSSLCTVLRLPNVERKKPSQTIKIKSTTKRLAFISIRPNQV